MAGIAGINKPGKIEFVEKMLGRISHRGKNGTSIFSTPYSTLGIVYTKSEESAAVISSQNKSVSDNRSNIHYASAKDLNGVLEISRDFTGAVPLYYGYMNNENAFCFASEIKSLAGNVNGIKEFPPGSIFFKDHITSAEPAGWSSGLPLTDPPEIISEKLSGILINAVKKRIDNNEFGCWLSGGLDSSIIAAAANKNLKKLFTFSAGLKDSPDILHARIMAEYLNSKHVEAVVSPDEMINLLPDVIYHLETFDPLLVRSSVMNFITARITSDYTDNVLSGEGGDELFGGYLYLKNIPQTELQGELLKLLKSLHNTALQRVDRCASAFSVKPHVPFLDPDVIEYAGKIPTDMKIKNGTEKWILREAFRKYLPVQVAERTKSKFWEGSGVGNLLAEYAERKISDPEFNNNRQTDYGIKLRTKEEYLFYSIFKEHFGEIKDVSFLGFTEIKPEDLI